MAAVSEGTLLWTPPEALQQRSRMRHYMTRLAQHRGLRFDTYDALWRWSVADLEGFWGSLWEYFGIEASAPYTRVLGRREMPGAQWFPGARLNYAQHALRQAGTLAGSSGQGTEGAAASAAGQAVARTAAGPAGGAGPGGAGSSGSGGRGGTGGPAVIYQSELRPLDRLSWG
ncbi:MAG TPA: acetyl-coenzyme A synthetase N-terminal domain-containing protein, partial [Thermaerobacter sp.]